jgi:hypothetical protein
LLSRKKQCAQGTVLQSEQKYRHGATATDDFRQAGGLTAREDLLTMDPKVLEERAPVRAPGITSVELADAISNHGYGRNPDVDRVLI